MAQIISVDPKRLCEQIDAIGGFDGLSSRLDLSSFSEISKIIPAAQQLAAGSLVAFPTETVYGLGASIAHPHAIAQIFAAKNRPSDNPLIIHTHSVDAVEQLICQKLLQRAAALAQHFWPGPLTMLLPRPAHIHPSVSAGHPTIAVRIPANPVARALIALAGAPIAAPSANSSGRPSPTTANHVIADLGMRIPTIIDGGSCDSGVESTVIDPLRQTPAILRPGGITLEQIRSINGFESTTVYNIHFSDQSLEQAPTTPGMKYKHYSPDAEVVLATLQDPSSRPTCASKSDQRRRIQEEINRILSAAPTTHIGILRTGDLPSDATNTQSNPSGQHNQQLANHRITEHHLGSSLQEVAHNLFAGLRFLESQQCSIIFIEAVHELDEGMAIMNRVTKASSRSI